MDEFKRSDNTAAVSNPFDLMKNPPLFSFARRAAIAAFFLHGTLTPGTAQTSVEGKSGQALNFPGPERRVVVPIGPKLQQLPVTFRFWVRLNTADDYNILLSSAAKKEVEHWEIFTGRKDGRLSLLMPQLGAAPLVTKTGLTDGDWHEVEFTIGPNGVQLSADGKVVLDQTANEPLKISSADVIVGGLEANPKMGMAGVIDELEIKTPTETLLYAFEENGVTTPEKSGGPAATIEGGGSASIGPGAPMPPAVSGSFLDELQDVAYAASGLMGDEAVEEESKLPVREVTAVESKEGVPIVPPKAFSLSGEWRMKDSPAFFFPEVSVNTRTQRNQALAAGWHKPGTDRTDWDKVQVPTSVQNALIKLGKLKDPMWDTNTYDELMEHGMPKDISWNRRQTRIEQSEWWFAREFTVPKEWRGKPLRLEFDGIDYSGSVFLNGQSLGSHAGMFGGPYRDVSGMVNFDGPNLLVVRIDPARATWDGIFKGSPGWGWHYGHLISLGIWRDVRLVQVPEMEITAPFVTTKAIKEKQALLEVEYTIRNASADFADLTVAGILAPKGQGGPTHFSNAVKVAPGLNKFRTQVAVDDPLLWWPFNYGDQNLYTLNLTTEAAGKPLATASTTFGIRTITMEAVGSKNPAMEYRWQYVINGQPMFIKGANWCWSDPMLICGSAKYERLLELAKRGGIQMLRAWGGGIVETDEFYRMCDEKGILVYQEFPFCWGPRDFPLTDPVVTDQQVTRVIKRLRNHPSLVMWGGGNENAHIPGNDEALFLVGKRSRQFDPSRPFHRTDPWGGSIHNWRVFHGGLPMDAGYKLKSGFFYGEYGFPSMTNRESTLKYLPEAKLAKWPPSPDDGGVIAHLNQFNLRDILKMFNYCDYGPITSWDQYTEYSQMAQGDWLQYAGEGQRAGSGVDKTGFWFYKLTDLFPGQSWAVIDYYGTPKLSYYRAKQVCQPQAAFASYEQFNWADDETFKARIHVANDRPAPLKAVKINATVYGSDLKALWSKEYKVESLEPNTRQELEAIEVAIPAAQKKPFLLAVKMEDAGGVMISDRCYWFNYQQKTPATQRLVERAASKDPKDALREAEYPAVFQAYASTPHAPLLSMPKTRLTLAREEKDGRGHLRIRNAGEVPAVNVMIEGFPDGWKDFLEDNSFFLRPGEERMVDYELGTNDSYQGPSVRAWNAPRTVL